MTPMFENPYTAAAMALVWTIGVVCGVIISNMAAGDIDPVQINTTDVTVQNVTYDPNIEYDCPDVNPEIINKQEFNIIEPGPYNIKVKNCIQLYNPGVFERIIQEVARDYEYVPDEFDCTEFTDEVVRRLREQGWKKAMRIQVKVDCDSGLFDKEICRQFKGRHDIVKIDSIYIEATAGVIINPNDYEDYGIRG